MMHSILPVALVIGAVGFVVSFLIGTTFGLLPQLLFMPVPGIVGLIVGYKLADQGWRWL